MKRQFAFLRAINAGPERVVKMDRLRGIFQSLGFGGVETFIASGNVIFEAKGGDRRALEERIERRLRRELGREVNIFLRTEAELKAIRRFAPFARRGKRRGGGINVVFLRRALGKRAKRKLLALASETDTFRVRGREIYWLRRRRPGKRDYASVPLEATLDGAFTIRSASTVENLAAKSIDGRPRMARQ